jgi:hypothetical protein
MTAWEEEMPLPVALWLPSPGKKGLFMIYYNDTPSVLVFSC